MTQPEDYLERLVAFGVYTTDHGRLQAVPLDELDPLAAAVRAAQARHYRNVAAMGRRQKIDCGASVYFSFLRPFAEVAGVADELDWTVPRDTVGPLYDALEPITGANAAPEGDEPYYLPIGP